MQYVVLGYFVHVNILDRIITVNFFFENFAVDHPVWVEEDGSNHEPRPLLVLKVHRLPDDSKTRYHNEHDD